MRLMGSGGLEWVWGGAGGCEMRQSDSILRFLTLHRSPLCTPHPPSTSEAEQYCMESIVVYLFHYRRIYQDLVVCYFRRLGGEWVVHGVGERAYNRFF